MRKIRNALFVPAWLVSASFPVLASGVERDPFHLPPTSVAGVPDESRYAGFISDGRCWIQWRIDASGYWRKTVPDYCAADLTFPPFTTAFTPQWCSGEKHSGLLPFACPP